MAENLKVPPNKLDFLVGPESASSDYIAHKNVYEFTPSKVHFWSLSSSLHYREDMLLVIKSIMPSSAAEAGIFNVENEHFKGFQQGDPRTRPERMDVDLIAMMAL